MNAIETIRFRNDTATRKRLMVPESFAHPAKGQLGMWATMIERYSQPGDLVLDPMAGSGATLLAALMGRNVICVELEPHFVEPMRRSWAKMRQMPMLGYEMGQAVILRGDARALPLPDASAGAVVTSPPWENKTLEKRFDGEAEATMFASKSILFQRGRSVEAIKRMMSKSWGGYTRPVDAIVTSPPFKETRPFASPISGRSTADYSRIPYEKRGFLMGDEEYQRYLATCNVGNLRGQAYWDSMARIYSECWRVLRPGGILALVLKGFTRDGQYVDLPGQTEALLLAAGWEKHDHWRRELWSLSFWRILQRRRDPAAFDDRLKYEEVLAFRKPGADGDGIAAVITSPPYEGSVQGEPGIDWTKTMGGVRDRTKEPAFETVQAIHSGYTRKAGDAPLLTVQEQRAAKRSVNRSIWGARDDALCRAQAAKVLAALRGGTT